jgi:hypothetical protein
MRLINVQTKKLELFAGRQKPPYAILSHTWGLDADEVSYEDFKDLSNCQDKPGFTKIDFICSQAKLDSCQYAWVDTCSIDKSSSSELSEAINSMFQWYQCAEVCYAFLADVEANSTDSKAEILQALKNSRWFQRGWTLQELIAPLKVVFFNKQGKFLGNKISFQDVITEITTIDKNVLQDSSAIFKTHFATRIYWASRRKTTRQEDLAYCLLGLFSINMPLLYGEGTKAFKRLQLELFRSSSPTSLLTWGLNNFGSRDTGLPSTIIRTLDNFDIFPAQPQVLPVLPKSPAAFTWPKITGLNTPNDSRPWIVSNRGLQIGMLVITDPTWNWKSSDEHGLVNKHYDLAIAVLPFRVPDKPLYLGILLSGNVDRGMFNRIASADACPSVALTARVASQAKPMQICLTDDLVYREERLTPLYGTQIQYVHIHCTAFQLKPLIQRGCKWEELEETLTLDASVPHEFQEALFQVSNTQHPNTFCYLLVSNSVLLPSTRQETPLSEHYRHRRLGIQILEYEHADEYLRERTASLSNSNATFKQHQIHSNNRKLIFDMHHLSVVISLEQKQVYWDTLHILTIRIANNEELAEIQEMGVVRSVAWGLDEI